MALHHQMIAAYTHVVEIMGRELACVFKVLVLVLLILIILRLVSLVAHSQVLVILLLLLVFVN